MITLSPEPINLPSNVALRNVRDLKLVCVPTADLQVDVTGKYNTVTYIHSFQPTFKLAGGINLPKIINCMGSDGEPYKQLVKVYLAVCF